MTLAVCPPFVHLLLVLCVIKYTQTNKQTENPVFFTRQLLVCKPKFKRKITTAASLKLPYNHYY